MFVIAFYVSVPTPIASSECHAEGVYMGMRMCIYIYIYIYIYVHRYGLYELFHFLKHRLFSVC